MESTLQKSNMTTKTGLLELEIEQRLKGFIISMFIHLNLHFNLLTHLTIQVKHKVYMVLTTLWSPSIHGASSLRSLEKVTWSTLSYTQN
jgi:hypothetical protein